MKRKIHVLVCDDNSFFRQMVSTLLAKDPAIEVVGEAASGEESVRMVAKTQPDVVLMDLKMAGMDGCEATRRIKTAYPATNVLVLTFLNDEAVVSSCMHAGASGYVLKGLQTAELVSAIQAVDRGEQHFSPKILKHVTRHRRRKGGRGHGKKVS